MTTAVHVLKLIQEHAAKFIDLRFTDTYGKQHHMTIPARLVNEEWFKTGLSFDGSSIAGWKGVHASDLLLSADPASARIDPFFDEPTLFMICDVLEPLKPEDGVGQISYEFDPRSIAKRGEAYLRSTGIGDQACFGPEPEFFIFDSVNWDIRMSGSFVKIHSEEAAWSSVKEFEGGNMGHRPAIKGGYFPVPPVDSLHDIRAQMGLILEELGIPVEGLHHEVASAGQCEVSTGFSTLTQRADWTQTLKYVVHNVAHQYGKTATFMPKPIVGDNGSGMHVHQSLWKEGKNLFAGDQYAALSETAIFYVGGILKHARALNALTNPGTNSYKRFVPHAEAPIKLAYSSCNRSAAIRIPYTADNQGRRIEARFPDPIANPYLAFTALLMAGLDGVEHRIHPGEPSDKNLYTLPPEEDAKYQTVCASLGQAIEALTADHDFLTRGGVFSRAFIERFITLKKEEVYLLRTTTHPIEFQLYYSL